MFNDIVNDIDPFVFKKWKSEIIYLDFCENRNMSHILKTQVT